MSKYKASISDGQLDGEIDERMARGRQMDKQINRDTG